MSKREWSVKSSDGEREYKVTETEAGWSCSCPSWRFRRTLCHHIIQVQNANGKEIVEPEITFAKVTEVTLERDEDGVARRVLTPLVPLGNTHFQATVVYDLLRAGVPWSRVKAQYDVAQRNSRLAIERYIEENGRLVYVYEPGVLLPFIKLAEK